MGVKSTIVEFGLLLAGLGFTLWVDDFYLPFIIIVDNFSVYLTIFSNERSFISKSLRSGETWSWWEHFSHLRNYLIITVARGALVQYVLAFYAGTHQAIELDYLFAQTQSLVKESAASYLVLLAFYDLIMSTIGNSVIFTCCLTIRSVYSLDLLKAKGLGATTPDQLMIFKNTLNGGFTTTTLTIINLVFRGDLRSLGSWLVTRPMMSALPFLQLGFVKLGLDVLHKQLLGLITPYFLLNNLEVPARVFDGPAVLTVFVLYLAFWQGNKIGNSIINLFF